MNRLALIHELIQQYDLKTKNRRREVLFKRYYLYNELRKAGLNLMQIGEIFDKDHSSIIHGLRTHEDLLACRNADYVAETRTIAEYLEGSELPDLKRFYKPKDVYDIYLDVLNASNMQQFKRIKRRVKMGIYEKKELSVQPI